MKIVPVLGVVLFAGCGVSEYKPRCEPSRPFAEFGRIEVREFRNSPTHPLKPEEAALAEAFARTLPLRVREKLVKAGRRVEGDGPALVIKGQVVTYQPGSQAVRYFVGCGAGAGEIVVDVAFRDESEAAVAEGTARGTVWAGLGGGTIGEAEDRVAAAIVRYVEGQPAGGAEGRKP